MRRDSTFLLRGVFYEAPPQFAGETIEVRFDPLDPSEVEIYVGEQVQAMARPVDPVLNAQLPSRKPLPGPAPVPTGRQCSQIPLGFRAGQVEVTHEVRDRIHVCIGR